VCLAILFASFAPPLGAQQQTISQPFHGLLDPDADLKILATKQTEYRAGLMATDAELAQLEAEIAPMRTAESSVSYQEGKILEGTRHRCLVTVAVARKSIGRILHKDSLRLEVQLAILLEAVNDEVDRFESLLANQVSTQRQESLAAGVAWAATLERIRKGDGDRRVLMLGYVLSRVARMDRPAEK
jgi:septal ring factor EnvC (AmiA/AmiB activator)